MSEYFIKLNGKNIVDNSPADRTLIKTDSESLSPSYNIEGEFRNGQRYISKINAEGKTYGISVLGLFDTGNNITKYNEFKSYISKLVVPKAENDGKVKLELDDSGYYYLGIPSGNTQITHSMYESAEAKIQLDLDGYRYFEYNESLSAGKVSNADTEYDTDDVIAECTSAGLFGITISGKEFKTTDSVNIGTIFNLRDLTLLSGNVPVFGTSGELSDFKAGTFISNSGECSFNLRVRGKYND